MELSEIADRKTKLQIISRLWGHVNDLMAHAKGTSKKTIGEIEKEIDLTEYYCRPYADCDDDELYAADILNKIHKMKGNGWTSHDTGGNLASHC